MRGHSSLSLDFEVEVEVEEDRRCRNGEREESVRERPRLSDVGGDDGLDEDDGVGFEGLALRT